MKLIVGLGNYGSKYEKTLHNMGFLTLAAVGKKLGLSYKNSECRARTDSARFGGEKSVFALPQTYMNLSGESVSELVHKYKIPPEDLLVVYDDLDLDRGALRLRASGSSGTHNGMRNIVAMLKTESFPRLRIGIGRPPHPDFDVADYVLSEVRREDAELMNRAISRAAEACEDFAGGVPFEAIMQKYNKKEL